MAAFFMCGIEIMNSEATADDKAVYLSLCYHANNDTGECYPGIRTICKETHLSPNTVVSCIRHLETLGLVIKRQGNGCPNRYFLTAKCYNRNNASEPKRYNGDNATVTTAITPEKPSVTTAITPALQQEKRTVTTAITELDSLTRPSKLEEIPAPPVSQTLEPEPTRHDLPAKAQAMHRQYFNQEPIMRELDGMLLAINRYGFETVEAAVVAIAMKGLKWKHAAEDLAKADREGTLEQFKKSSPAVDPAEKRKAATRRLHEQMAAKERQVAERKAAVALNA